MEQGVIVVTNGDLSVQSKISWVTRPWHKDWIFWVFLVFWTIFSWQSMFTQGRTSSIAWTPAVINLVAQVLTGFAITAAFIALPLLIIRRLYRGHLAKNDMRDGKPTPTYGQGQARGWGVWLLVAVTVGSVLFWVGGRDQNPLVNIVEGRGVTTGQVNPDLMAQLESLRPDPDEAAKFLIDSLEKKPGFQAHRAYQDIQELLEKYFTEDPNSGDVLATFERLRGYLGEVDGSNAVLAENLDLVTSQSEMPSVSPDINLLRDFSVVLQPWLDARLSYYAALDACNLEVSEDAMLDCQVFATDEWEPKMIATIRPLDIAVQRLR